MDIYIYPPFPVLSSSVWDVKEVDDHSSPFNTSKILIRVQVGEIVIQLARHVDQHDVPYLMFRLNRVCLDAAVTVYGLVAHASLGGLQLVDKIHIGMEWKHHYMVTKSSAWNILLSLPIYTYPLY